MREHRYKSNEIVKKRGEGGGDRGKKSESLLQNQNSISRENYTGKFIKIYCTISPAGKRSFGKNLTIVETKFLNNILSQHEERNFFSLPFYHLYLF